MSPLSTEHQIGGLAALGYVEDLFSHAGKQVFTRDEILVLLNLVKNDPEIFHPVVVEEVERAGVEYEREQIEAGRSLTANAASVCQKCFGTGRESFKIDGYAYSRKCRHDADLDQSEAGGADGPIKTCGNDRRDE